MHGIGNTGLLRVLLWFAALDIAIKENYALSLLNTAINFGERLWQGCEEAAARVRELKLHDQVPNDTHPATTQRKLLWR